MFVSILKVTKMLGNGRLEAMCFDGVKRLCHIRGKLRKKVEAPHTYNNLLTATRRFQTFGRLDVSF